MKDGRPTLPREHGRTVRDDREIARGIASALHEFLARKIDHVVLAGRLRKVASLAERAPILAERVPVKADQHATAFDQVFRYWQGRMGHPQAKPGPRRSKVLARLREGYSVDQLRMAIQGCAASPHHMGENATKTRYDDLTLICRDGAKVEFFMGIAKERGATRDEAPIDAARAKLEAEADEALAAGDTDTYNALQERMAAHG